MAFFTLLMVETDRLPIHSSTHIEVYMIDEARILEYSGPLLALLKWASMMKQFILYTIFCNVLLFLGGCLRQGTRLGDCGSSSPLWKFLFVALAVIVVETAQSRLRFYRYQELLAASFVLRCSQLSAPVDLIMFLAHARSVVASIFSLMAIASLLLAFVMLGSRWLSNYLYAFAAQSWIIAALSARSAISAAIRNSI